MGTSTSSSGPSSNISFDPPWLDKVGPDTGGANDEISDEEEQTNFPQQDTPQEVIAPTARFRAARTKINNFATSGDRTAFRKAVGHYSKTGMGGASQVANRMRASVRTVTSLVSFLRDVQSGTNTQVNNWVQNLIGQDLTANQMIDAIIESITLDSGTLDEDSIKNSMSNAMSDLLEESPDSDLLHMTDGDTWSFLELFLAHEATNRLHIDIGQIFESSDLSPSESIQRVEEMHEYLKEEIIAQIYPFKNQNQHPEIDSLEAILKASLENTFMVFEEAVE